MTVAKKEIKEIRKLQNLDPQTMKRIEDEVKRIQAQAAADEASRKAAESEKDKAAKAKIEAAIKLEADSSKDKEKGAQLLKEFQDLQRGKELLQRFPPDKWGPQTAKEVADKALRKQPVTAEEREFLDPETQKYWSMALKAQQDAA